MPTYQLRYARVVYLTTEIEAVNEDDAQMRAWNLELEGKLGLESWEPKEGSDVEDVFDYDAVWEIEEIEGSLDSEDDTGPGMEAGGCSDE